MDISVVIPVYGCRAALRELYERLTKSLNEITAEYEIILANDNCPQNSWEVIEQICLEDRKVKGIQLSRNFGQMPAILAGLDHSTGDWVVVMDCDLQDRPEEIINLYNKAQEGYDVVFARRKTRKDSSFKILVSKAFYKIFSFATDRNYDPALCNFSICRRAVIERIAKCGSCIAHMSSTSNGWDSNRRLLTYSTTSGKKAKRPTTLEENEHGARDIDVPIGQAAAR